MTNEKMEKRGVPQWGRRGKGRGRRGDKPRRGKGGLDGAAGDEEVQ